MIQLTRAATICCGSSKDLEQLRGQFRQQHCVRFSRFLEPELLQYVQSEVARAEFYKRTHEGLTPPAVDLCMKENVASKLLTLFLMNDTTLFNLIQQITGCDPIGSFEGCVYRMMPGVRHGDSWHNDMGQSRLVGASINLSTEVYVGGVLQICDWQSGAIVQEVANTGPGDAIVFELSDRLKHRVTDVQGSVPRTVFAGWFCSQPVFAPLTDWSHAAV